MEESVWHAWTRQQWSRAEKPPWSGDIPARPAEHVCWQRRGGTSSMCSCPTGATVARRLVTLWKMLRWTRWDLLKSSAMDSGIPQSVYWYQHVNALQVPLVLLSNTRVLRRKARFFSMLIHTLKAICVCTYVYVYMYVYIYIWIYIFAYIFIYV